MLLIINDIEYLYLIFAMLLGFLIAYIFLKNKFFPGPTFGKSFLPPEIWYLSYTFLITFFRQGYIYRIGEN